MNHFKHVLAASCLIALAGCTTSAPGYYPGGSAMYGVADPHAETARQSRLVNCNVPSGHRLNANPASARPGDGVELRHSFEFSAYGAQHIPLTCVDHWRIDPPEAATLSDDRRTLRVAGSAVPGNDIRVTVTASGYQYTLILPVVGPGETGIHGNWRSLPSQGCFGSPAPREIRFDSEGFALFALGLRPSVWDDRREFTFDHESGMITLGGQTGSVHVNDEDHLVITGLRLPSAFPLSPSLPRVDGIMEEVDWSSCQMAFSRTSSFR